MRNKTRKTLKNLLFAAIPISIASFLPMKEANGQMARITGPTTLYFIFQPGDLGLGFRGDYRFSLGTKQDHRFSQFGMYSLASIGNYKLGKDEYINNHFKLSLGGIFYLREKPFEKNHGFINLGLSYHDYGEKSYCPGTINENAFNHLSTDIGFGVRRENFSAFISVDPIKGEGTVGAGINFGALSKNPLKKYHKLLAEVYSKT